VPQFKDYPVAERYAGKTAPLVLTRDSRMYRTMLRDAADKRPNFAGHYILATWGCGAGCVMGYVIDAKTGVIRSLPFTICCWPFDVGDNFEPVDFRLDSKLIIFTGARNEKGNGTYYYKFEHDRFVPVREIEKPAHN
jgi:hypothetical protein